MRRLPRPKQFQCRSLCLPLVVASGHVIGVRQIGMGQEHRIFLFRLPRCSNAIMLLRYDADFLFAVTSYAAAPAPV
jgi:hypothetical protein